MKMRTFGKAAVLSGLLAAGLVVAAELKAGDITNTLREGQGVVTELGPNASAITYWVTTSGGWQVVTTVDTVINRDSSAERHAIVRFSAVLLPGQIQLISVPVAIGEQQPVVRIRRIGDQIEITRRTCFA